MIRSAGFLPDIYEISCLYGILGFIVGSFFIGVSQSWKLARISRTSVGGLFGSLGTSTAAGVEGGACLGAWGFFFGTCLYWYIEQALPRTSRYVIFLAHSMHHGLQPRVWVVLIRIRHQTEPPNNHYQ